MRYIYTKKQCHDVESGITYLLSNDPVFDCTPALKVVAYYISSGEDCYHLWSGEDAVSFWQQLAAIAVMNGESALFRKRMLEDLEALSRSIKDDK